MKLADSILDELVGLHLDEPGADDKIVQAVEKRFSEMEWCTIYLMFEKENAAAGLLADEDAQEQYTLEIVQDNYDVSKLRADLAALRQLHFAIIGDHGS
jgi:pyruvate dehydrogenase complex dehydrogenase (E1) component